VLDPSEPYYWTDAPQTGSSALRKVVMFRLVPASRAIGVPRAERVRLARLPRHPTFSTAYRPADENAAAAPRDPFHVDPDIVDRGLRSHAATQNALAEAARERRLDPLSPGPTDPDFDLAWLDGDTLVLAEVKSITAGNEVKQLRLGLGQLLDYLDQARRSRENVRGLLAIEASPSDPRWSELCQRHGVTLVWPPNFEEAFEARPTAARAM
jgi:hypothetical protein